MVEKKKEAVYSLRVVLPFGGLIAQSWLDRPLALVGKVVNSENEVIDINTKWDGYTFTINKFITTFRW